MDVYSFKANMTTSTKNVTFIKGAHEDDNKNLKVTPGRNTGESEEILPFCLPYLTPDMIKEAETHLHETKEKKTRCLREFRNFIKNQKNLVTPTDDLYLLSFLRARKYDLEKTYKLFLNFWKFRKDYRNYYENVNLEAHFSFLFRNVVGYLEHRDKNGASVLVLKIGQWNPDLDSFDTIFVGITVILLLSLEYDANQISGMRVIIDTRGLSWAHMKYCTPSVISLLVNSTQFSFPGRYKGVHVITDSKLFRVFWSLAYPMLSRKIKERIFLHSSDLKPIRKYIHPSVLPVDFGGDAPAFETTKWENYYNDRLEEFLVFSQYGYKDL